MEQSENFNIGTLEIGQFPIVVFNNNRANYYPITQICKFLNINTSSQTRKLRLREYDVITVKRPANEGGMVNLIRDQDFHKWMDTLRLSQKISDRPGFHSSVERLISTIKQFENGTSEPLSNVEEITVDQIMENKELIYKLARQPKFMTTLVSHLVDTCNTLEIQQEFATAQLEETNRQIKELDNGKKYITQSPSQEDKFMGKRIPLTQLIFHLNYPNITEADLREFLLDQGIIYIGEDGRYKAKYKYKKMNMIVDSNNANEKVPLIVTEKGIDFINKLLDSEFMSRRTLAIAKKLRLEDI